LETFGKFCRVKIAGRLEAGAFEAEIFALLVASSLLQPVVLGSHEDRANHRFLL
jgi:hypothetical protein